MQAIEITAPGGPEVLRRCERPDPVPRAGEVLVRVAAAGVNRPDLLQRRGAYAPPPGASDLPGLEIAGTIVGGDVGDSGLAIGDRVCALTHGGGYAQLCAVQASHCLPLPPGLTEIEAAALPETCFTVWSNVFDRGRLAPGETLLVHGGASGIGTIAIQIASALGHRVFATAGSARKVLACESLGAVGIDYKTQNFAAEVRRLTADRGVDVVLDMVAGEYVARDIECLADDGRIVMIAMQGGSIAELPLAQIMTRRLTLTGSTLRPRSVAYKARIARQLHERVWPLISSGRVRPVIAVTFPLEQAADAHAELERGDQVGKIVLTL